MLRKTVYPKIEHLLNQIAQQVLDLGITPNQLTLAGLAVNFLAGIFFANGLLFLGSLLMLIAGAADMLDGPVARLGKKATPFGAFLDSTIDRYSDFFLFGGLALHFAKTNQNGSLLLCLGIILGAFAVSYSKARAENFIEDCQVGIFERTERILLLLAGILFRPLLTFCLWALFLGTHITAVHRIWHTKNKLEGEETKPDASE